MDPFFREEPLDFDVIARRLGHTECHQEYWSEERKRLEREKWENIAWGNGWGAWEDH